MRIMCVGLICAKNKCVPFDEFVSLIIIIFFVSCHLFHFGLVWFGLVLVRREMIEGNDVRDALLQCRMMRVELTFSASFGCG